MINYHVTEETKCSRCFFCLHGAKLTWVDKNKYVGFHFLSLGGDYDDMRIQCGVFTQEVTF